MERWGGSESDKVVLGVRVGLWFAETGQERLWLLAAWLRDTHTRREEYIRRSADRGE